MDPYEYPPPDPSRDASAPAAFDATSANAGLGRLSPEARLACPRCDHDLRAEPMGWTEACPLSGQCSECGLEFEWMDLLSRRHALPRWSVEAGTGAREWVRRWPAQQFMAALRPLRVHRRLRLEHHRRPRRLAAALVPLVLLAVIVPLVRTGWQSWGAGMTPGLVVRDVVQPWRNAPSTVWVPIAGSSRRGYVWLIDINGRWSEIDDLLGTMNQPAVLPAELGFVRRPAGGNLVRVPLPEGVNVLVMTDGTGAVPPAVAKAVQGPVTVPRRGPVPLWETATWLLRFGTFALPIIAVPVAAAAAFIVLPVVRHRARVSAGHIVRLMLLGLLLSFPIGLLLAWFATRGEWPYGAWLLMRSSGMNGFDFDQRMLVEVGGPVALTALVTFLWIRSAAIHHLRLERPTAVAAASTAVAITTVFTVWFIVLVAT